MTAAEELDALRRIMVKKPRIRLRTALRTIHEREAIARKVEQLRAEMGLPGRGRPTRAAPMAGTLEGFIYG